MKLYKTAAFNTQHSISQLVRDRLGVHSEAAITVDGKKMTGSGKLEFIQDHPVVDLVLDSPEGKSKFLWRTDKKVFNLRILLKIVLVLFIIVSYISFIFL
jgi:hypothetical protein